MVDTSNAWIAVWYVTSFGSEGDMGSRTDVALIDTASCRVKRPE